MNNKQSVPDQNYIKKYVSVIEDVKTHCDQKQPIKVVEFARKHRITASILNLLIGLGIVKKTGKFIYEWNTDQEINQAMALAVMYKQRENIATSFTKGNQNKFTPPPYRKIRRRYRGANDLPEQGYKNSFSRSVLFSSG